jgi:hypothetical protein
MKWITLTSKEVSNFQSTVDFKSIVGDNSCMLTNSEIENMKIQANTQKPNSLHFAIYQSSDRECMFQGFKHWDVSKSDKYRQVCTVDFFAGYMDQGNPLYIESLDDVFALLNGQWEYDAHVKGFGIVEGVRKSDGVEYCFRDMHSLSVGDIIVDHCNAPYNKAYIVDSFGFEEIEFTQPEKLAHHLPVHVGEAA